MTDTEVSFKSAVLAVHLPSAPSDTRQAADKWLRSLARTDEGWNFLLSICTSNPDENWSPDERHIAAALLSAASLKGAIRLQSIPEAETMLLSLGRAILHAAHFGAQATAASLSRSIAALLIRSPCISETEIVTAILGALTSAAGGVMPQEERQQCALLRALSALVEVSAQTTLSVHPARRQAVQSALLSVSAGVVTSLVVSAQGEDAPEAVQVASMEVVRSWCGCAGSPPPGFELEGLHFALSRPHIRHEAADTLAALYQVGGSLMPHLLNNLPAAMVGLASQASQYSQHAFEVHSAALTILGAATSAAASNSHLNSNSASLFDCSAAAEFLSEQLLSLLTANNNDLDSVLANLAVWEEWLASPQGPSSPPSLCRPSQNHLSRFLECLLHLAQLPDGLSIEQITADARDLPEEVRHARREVGDTLKLAISSLGDIEAGRQILHAAMHAQAVLSSSYNYKKAGTDIIDTRDNDHLWIPLEACLYALNLVPRTKAADQEPLTLFQITALGVDALLPETPKLAGTALTLLGGLAVPYSALYVYRPETFSKACWQGLKKAIVAVSRLLQQPTNAKLARNAATTLHRLSSAPLLATFITQELPNVLEELMSWYASQTAGTGVQRLLKTGVDETTSEYTLRTLCNMNMHCALLRHHRNQAALSLDSSSNNFHVGVAALHVHALGLVLRECSTESSSVPGQSKGVAVSKDGVSFTLPEQEASDILQLLNTSASAAIVNKSAAGSGQLASALAKTAARLIAAFLPSAEHAVQAILSVAAHCGTGALEAMQTVVSSADDIAANTVIQAFHIIVVQASAAVQPAVVHPVSGTVETEERLVHMLLIQVRLLQGICIKWPVHVASTPEFISVALGKLQMCMPHSNRDICESSISLAAAVLSLGNRLHDGALTAAVHFLLCSASGGHPSYVILPVSDAAYAGWRAQGGERFKAATLAAMQQSINFEPAVSGGAPAPAPWATWKEDMVHSVLDDLLSQESVADPKRFKKIFKQLCGGKKKGTVGAPPGRRDM